MFSYVSGNAVFSVYLQIPHPRCRRTEYRVRGNRGAGLGFCGSTPIRRLCSWATSARSRLAPRSGQLQSSVRQELVLVVMGGIFVVETLSVMIQVASFS